MAEMKEYPQRRGYSTLNIRCLKMAKTLRKLASGLASLAFSLVSFSLGGCFTPQDSDYDYIIQSMNRSAGAYSREEQTRGEALKREDITRAAKAYEAGEELFIADTARNFNVNIDELRRFYRAGFSPFEGAILMKEKVPLEYAVKKKDILKPYQIESAYYSRYRDLQTSDKTVRQVYGPKGIVYTRFSDLELKSSESEELVPVPKDLFRYFVDSSHVPITKDFERFREIFLAEARAETGATNEELFKKDAVDSICLSAVVACRRLKYKRVDSDPEFVQKYGSLITVERSLEIGEGDCKRHAWTVQLGFAVLKERNPRLKNIHVTSKLGGVMDLSRIHEWNTVIHFTKDKNGKPIMLCSQIDPTFFNNYGGALSVDERHLDKDNFVPNVFRDLAESE